MAIYSQSELAELLNKSMAFVTMYWKRGKLVRNADGKYDDTEMLNAAFIRKQLLPKNERREKKPKPEPKPKPFKAPVADRKEAFVERAKQPNAEADNYINLETRIKTKQAEKLEKEVELLEIKIDKANATLIPTEAVTLLFQQHFKHTAIAYKDALERWITNNAKKFKMTNSDIAQCRSEVLKVVNAAVQEASESTIADVERIANDFAEVRAKYERK
jgi:hypothetical protein